MWTMYEDTFYLEHRRCGRWDADVENGWVPMTCEWGADIVHSVTEVRED